MKRVASRTWLAALVVLTLALSVGANLIVFTVVKALWLSPMPLPNADRIVLIPVGTLASSGGSEGGWWAQGGLDRLRREPVFEAVTGQVATTGENSVWRPRITLQQTGREVETAAVTSEYFSVMGLPIRGRDFTRNDDRNGAPLVGIISERLWRTAFDASAAIIGTDVATSTAPIRVIGVAPAGFHGVRLGENVDLWIPRFGVAQVAQYRRPIGVSFEPSMIAFARLKHGPSVEDAMQIIGRSGESSGSPMAQPQRLIPISRIYGNADARTIVVEQTTMMWLAAGASVVVLIAGCATLMGLVFVYYERRRQELAVRMALGCSGMRLAGLLARDLGGLATAGGIVAFGLAALGFRMIPLLRLPGGIDLGRFNLSPDWRVVLFGAVLSLMTFAIGAYAPLRRATRNNLVAELIMSSSKWTSSFRLRRDIVALQVAVTVVALVAAGPFVRRIVDAHSYRPLFDVEHALFAEVKTDWPFESSAERRARQLAEPARIGQVLDEIRALPGVLSASLGRAPIGPEQANALTSSREHQFPRIIADSRMRYLSASHVDVGSAYFQALSLTFMAGRPLTDSDAAFVYERPVVVTKSFADAMWPGGLAIDRTFGFKSGNEYRVVGVVNDVSFGSLSMNEHRGVFRPTNPAMAAVDAGPLSFAVRATEPGLAIDLIRRTISVGMPMAFDIEISTGIQILDRDNGRERVAAWFFAGFGAVALALGAAGVFGLVAYVAESRKREIGIRLALGATSQHLMSLMVRSSITPVVAGTAAGIGVSAVFGQVISTTFIDFQRLGVETYASVAAVMLVVGMIASLAAGSSVRRVPLNDILRSE